MNRCVIVGAAQISNYERIKKSLKQDDFYIVCDAGMEHCKNLDISPDLIIGDFDSFEKKKLSSYEKKEIIELPCEKDDTDVFYAVKEAVKRGFNDFFLIGVIGNRFDHSLCNISVLLYLFSLKKNAVLADDYSEMEIVSDKEVFIEDKYSFFSLMTVSGPAQGVFIKNAKYPLENAVIEPEFQFAISNEVLKGKKASIKILKGKILLIKVW